MKVTKDNIRQIDEKNARLLEELLSEIDEVNRNDHGLELYIDYIDEYESLWYGLYKIRSEKVPTESIGFEMTVDELDKAICIVSNTFDIINKAIKRE